jgi:isopenicillin N synthase-like dioxygenase
MADTGAVAGPAIPIVNLKEEEPAVVKQLHDAFSGIGFIFVVNHSISRQQIMDTFEVAHSFFQLEDKVKTSCARSKTTKDNGYVAMETEALDPSKPGDLKECYNSTGHNNEMWPQDSIPQFKPAVTGFYSSCQDLALQLLLYMGKSLQLAVSAMQHNIVRKEHWLVEIFVRTMGSSKE